MNSRSSLAICSAVVVLMGQLVSASAVVRYVNVNNPNPIAPYTNWATAATVIQDAVDVALSGDEVLVTNGVYQTGGRALNGGVTNRVAVDIPIILRSVNGADATVIQGYKVPGTIHGTNAVRGVYLTNHAVLTGFTVTGGATMGNVFEDAWGGGIQCEGNSAVISNCVISGNAAWLDGGGAFRGTLSWCSISNNTARGYSEGGGGGVAYAAVNNSLIIGNIGTFGGGVIYSDVNNCLITGNAALASGGGAYAGNLNNCTVTDNQARSRGGGTVDSKHTNSIVYYNNAPSGSNHDGGFETQMHFCCTTPLPEVGTNNFTAEPLLASFSRLSTASPCRAFGDPAAVTGSDIDGELWANPPSIGCDEFNVATGSLTVAISTPYLYIATGYPLPLRADIAGKVSASVWDFGDGTILSNRPVVIHQWNAPGNFNVIVRAYNNSNPGGISSTTVVHVVNTPTHHVRRESTNPQSPYLTWATAATNIQDAVDAAYAGGTVLVTNGFYDVGFREVSGYTNRLAVTRPIVVQSVSGPAVTSITGDGQMRCVYLTNGATLSGFTLTNGYSPSSGGGVFCESSLATVSNCVIRSCTGNYGGGVYSGTIIHSFLHENSVVSYGGAAFGSVLDNCLVISNSASYGGGSAIGDLINCTLVGNVASSGGGGAYSCRITNCIIYYNHAVSPSSAANIYLSEVGYTCTTPGSSGASNIFTEPLFVNLTAGNFHLRANSPCRDAGDNSAVTASTDLDGNSRVLNGSVDLGAYEFDPPAPPSPAAPYAFTGKPQHTLPISARLTGFATPNGTNAVAWFEWGLRGNLSQTTQPILVGNTDTVQYVFAGLTNLNPQVTYQCRLVVSNALGVTYGSKHLFTTGARLRVWGDNAYGQTNMPAGLSNAVMVAAGNKHSVALRNDGTVVAWGDTQRYQTGVPAGLSNVVSIAARSDHSLALKSDGHVVAWGSYSYTLVPAFAPASLSNVVSLAVGRMHSVALKSDGTVAVWGLNTPYGLTNVPVGLSNVVEIASGEEIVIAIKNDGTLTAWGNGDSGRTNIPAGLTNVIAASANFFSAWALTAQNLLVPWGYDNYEAWHNKFPHGVTNLIDVSSGEAHTLALTDYGAAVGWGYDITGQLINGVPPGISNVIGIAAGDGHNVVVLENTAPQAVAQSFTSAASQDLVIQLKGTDVDLDLLSYRVTTLPTAGTLYQYDNGTRGTIITVTNASVTDLLGRLVFAPVPGSLESTQVSFGFVVNDRSADSVPAQVTIQVIAETPFAITKAATRILTNSATLNGMITPRGLPSSAWFEWGANNNFDLATVPQSVGNGLNVAAVRATITNLIAGQVVNFRLVVSNAAGVVRGADRIVTTSGRVTAWGNNTGGQLIVPTNLSRIVQVGAGDWHSAVLRNDGSGIAWGHGPVNQNVGIADGNNIISISEGGEHGLGLSTNNTVLGWGQNNFGQINIPPGLTNVVGIAAGGQHSMALRDNGLVTVWGINQASFSNYLQTVSNVVDVAAGWGHSLMLMHDGTVTKWGAYEVPAELTNVVSIAAGSNHSLALLRDGSVVGWGENLYNKTVTPPGVSNVVLIQAWGSQSAALRRDGTLIVWGANQFNQTNVPAGLSNIATFAVGAGHVLALTPNRPPVVPDQSVTGGANTDLTIQLSGSDLEADPFTFSVGTLPASGALYQYSGGVRGAAITATPTLVSDPSGRVIFAPNPGDLGLPYTSFAISANDGEVDSANAVVTVSIIARIFAQTLPARQDMNHSAQLAGFVSPESIPAFAWFEWGTNTAYGQNTAVTDAGSGRGVVHLTQPIAGLAAGQVIHFRLVASNTSQIVYGMDQQFVTSGKVVGWGDNSSGQAATPTNLGAVVSVAGGLSHSLALRANGTVVAWGNNLHGQTNVSPALGGVTAVAAGGFHNVALLTNGNIAAWGRNQSGQTNVSASAINIVQIAAGGQHSIALRSDGTLVAWGDNSQGQRTISGSLTNIVGIAAGWLHNVALRSDGSVRAWGANIYGQTNVPASATNIVWVGSGLYHSLALRRDGTLITWGLGSSGQTNTPSDATNIIAAAGGGSHNLVQRYDGFLFGWGNNFAGQTTIPPAVSNVVNFAAGGSHSLALLPNRPPVAFAQTVAGYPNTDLLITLNGSDADVDSLKYRIDALPTAGVLFQYNSGVRGAQIFAADSIVTDTLGRLVFAPAADQAGSPHATFDFSASDGFVFSSPATVTVNVVLPLAPTFDLAASTMTTNGTFQLAFTGGSNAAYRVWASTNLVNWELLGSAAPSATGHFVFLDSTATNSPQRFYRATAP